MEFFAAGNYPKNALAKAITILGHAAGSAPGSAGVPPARCPMTD